MYAEVAWVLVSSGTQVQPQIILNPDYLPDYLSVSYDYTENIKANIWFKLSNWKLQKRFCRKDFVENSKFIGESTEAAVRGCSSINSHENARGGVQL